MEENIITSVQNARIKHVVALQQKSSLRREEGLFVVEGQRELEHCIACGYEIVEVFTVDGLQFTVDGLQFRVDGLQFTEIWERNYWISDWWKIRCRTSSRL